MNIDDPPTTVRPTDRPTSGLFTQIGRPQMALSQRHVVRSTSCLFQGWGFRGRWIEQRHFRLYLAAIL